MYLLFSGQLKIYSNIINVNLKVCSTILIQCEIGVRLMAWNLIYVKLCLSVVKETVFILIIMYVTTC
jgi:hypothetical protein